MTERMTDNEFENVFHVLDGANQAYLYTPLKKEAKRAREAEKRLEEEIEFLNKNYMDEDDKSLTLDAQLLKAKLIIKKLEAENAALTKHR